MANQEEDATELNFPKEWLVDLWEDGEKGILHQQDWKCKPICYICEIQLNEPFIECNECEGIKICLACFSKGMERNEHTNDHDYIVARQNFSLFDDSEWLAKEETLLLTCINECGLGNWTDIGLRVGRPANECKNHYFKHYIQHPIKDLEILNKIPFAHSSPSHIPFTDGIEEPPRPVVGSNISREMMGYNAARGDFVVEYNNEAESVLNCLDYDVFVNDSTNSLGKALELSIADMYRRSLGERQYRKQLIREHGLVNFSKFSAVQVQDKAYLPPEIVDLLPKLYQYFGYEELRKFVAGFYIENELEKQISILKEYRVNGICKQLHIANYEMLKRVREQNFRRKNRFNLKGKLYSLAINKIQNCRRDMMPLNITNKIGYEKLDNEEKVICSDCRFLPEDFLNFKSIMIDECNKLNGLKLVNARNIIKVDVNKIRKLYDHLILTGAIYLPKHLKCP